MLYHNNKIDDAFFMNRFSSCTDVICLAARAEKQAGLTASDPAAGEPGAASAGAGKPVDSGPADAPVVANPGLAVGSDTGEKRKLAVAAVGLCPIAFAGRFETPQIEGVADGVNAVGVAIRIHAGQQIGATGALGQARNLGRRVCSHQQGKHDQCRFKGVAHGLSHEGGAFSILSFALLSKRG